MRFNRLPIEIQFDIFATMSAHTLCQTIAPVCRQWRQFAYEPLLWSVVQLDGLEQCIEIMQHCTHVRNLDIFDTDDFNWLKKIPQRKSLREVSFYDCTISEDAMQRFVATFPYVQKYADNSFDSINSSLVPQIVKWEYLTDLTLPDQARVYLDLITNNCQNLTHFYAMSLESDEDQSSIVNFLKLRGPQLRVLKIGELYEVESDTYHLLSHCQNLTELELSGAKNLTDDVFAGFRDLKKLTSLEIFASHRLFSPDFPILCSGTEMPSLKVVVFEWCTNINYVSLNCLLKNCPALEKLITSLTSNLTESNSRLLAIEHQFNYVMTKGTNVAILQRCK